MLSWCLVQAGTENFAESVVDAVHVIELRRQTRRTRGSKGLQQIVSGHIRFHIRDQLITEAI